MAAVRTCLVAVGAEPTGTGEVPGGRDRPGVRPRSARDCRPPQAMTASTSQDAPAATPARPAPDRPRAGWLSRISREAAILFLGWVLYTAGPVRRRAAGRSSPTRTPARCGPGSGSLGLPDEAAMQAAAMKRAAPGRDRERLLRQRALPADHRRAGAGCSSGTPGQYSRTRRSLLWITAAALVVHLLFPLAPPRLALWDGMTDTGVQYGMSVYGPVGTGIANQFAAMPSLHFGWSVLVAVAVVTQPARRWRWVVRAASGGHPARRAGHREPLRARLHGRRVLAVSRSGWRRWTCAGALRRRSAPSSGMTLRHPTGCTEATRSAVSHHVLLEAGHRPHRHSDDRGAIIDASGQVTLKNEAGKTRAPGRSSRSAAARCPERDGVGQARADVADHPPGHRELHRFGDRRGVVPARRQQRRLPDARPRTSPSARSRPARPPRWTASAAARCG